MSEPQSPHWHSESDAYIPVSHGPRHHLHKHCSLYKSVCPARVLMKSMHVFHFYICSCSFLPLSLKIFDSLLYRLISEIYVTFLKASIITNLIIKKCATIKLKRKKSSTLKRLFKGALLWTHCKVGSTEWERRENCAYWLFDPVTLQELALRVSFLI